LPSTGAQIQSGGYEHVEIPSHLDRQFVVTTPNQVWCGDVIYIWTGKCWAYLAVVLGLFVRKLVGWAISTSPGLALTVKALQIAWELCGRPTDVMTDVTLQHFLLADFLPFVLLRAVVAQL